MAFTLGKKLGLSFGLILTLLMISSGITYSLILHNEIVQERMVNVRMKTVLFGKDVTNGVNQSLAGLRGYLIFNHEAQKAMAMKVVRASAWESIEHAMRGYEALAEKWTVEENIQRLNQITAELAEFKIAQQEIEDIAVKDENIASYHLLLSQAAPKAKKMLAHITQIINEEGKLEATVSRKKLLNNLADVRGSFAIGLANIRAFLLSGEENFKDDFNEIWKVNEDSVNAILSNQLTLFTLSQKESWDLFISLRDEFERLPQRMFNLRNAEDWNKANYWLGTKAAPRATNILSLLDDMKASQEQLLITDIKDTQDVLATLKLTLITCTVISLIVGIFCSMLFSRNLLSRLKSILERSTSIANGDMAGAPLVLKGKDELTDLTFAINQMSTSLSGLVQKSADSMLDASNGTNDILSANEKMASIINEQTAQMEQIASAIEELSNSSTEVASNCVSASDSSMAALKLAKAGGELVKNTLSQMGHIKNIFDDGSAVINSLSDKSKDIGAILDVIKGIADQTNLLALNAAIEAARAGEQGRGFAVVSDEVRQLAGRTTEATAEVEVAIDSMRTETDNVVNMMAKGTHQVEQGLDLTKDSEVSLGHIIKSVDDVVAQIQLIAATAEEQSITTAEVAQNTDNVASLSQAVETEVNTIVTLSNGVAVETKNKAKELLSMI